MKTVSNVETVSIDRNVLEKRGLATGISAIREQGTGEPSF